MVRLRLFALFSVFFFLNCFEYEETLVFRRPNSGTLEVSYIVPLKKNSDESLLQFLPATAKSIEERFKKRTGMPLKIRDFSFRILDKSELPDSLFKRKGKVSYKFDFEDSSILDAILLGTTTVKGKQKQVTIKRDFPSFATPITETSSSGEKKIVSETYRLLKDAKVSFRVLFPKDSECSSNKGFVGLGSVVYGFSVAEATDPFSLEGRNWELKIRFF